MKPIHVTCVYGVSPTRILCGVKVPWEGTLEQMGVIAAGAAFEHPERVTCPDCVLRLPGLGFVLFHEASRAAAAQVAGDEESGSRFSLLELD